MLNPNRISRALLSADNYIASKQREDGLWEDFQTSAGHSTDWVTAYVAHAISCGDHLRENIEQALKALLRRQRPNGGWSYNENVPTDCDSTAWALLALSSRPFCRPSVRHRAQRYITLHQDLSKGGFCTYSAQDGIERYIGAQNSRLTRGWRSPHACVTSAVIQALLEGGESPAGRILRPAVNYLLGLKGPSGLWQSYWWVGHSYATYHTLKGLIMAGVIHFRDLEEARVRFANCQRSDGGWSCQKRAESEVFETAYALLCLLLYPTRIALNCASKAADWLLKTQEATGSWPVAPMLRIPFPMVEDPTTMDDWVASDFGTGVVVQDSAKLFTSATAHWALSAFGSVAF
jgi:squalene cyclase